MVRDVFAASLLKQMPIFEGKMFQRYKQEAILYHRRCGFKEVFRQRVESPGVNEGDTGVNQGSGNGIRAAYSQNAHGRVAIPVF